MISSRSSNKIRHKTSIGCHGVDQRSDASSSNLAASFYPHVYILIEEKKKNQTDNLHDFKH